MAWRDIALAMAGDSSLDEDAIGRWRKAFERAKAELKQMAKEEGLLEPR